MGISIKRIFLLGVSACCLAVYAQELPVVTPVVETSYATVAKYLNPGGNVYAYMNTAEWAANLGKQIEKIEGLVQEATGGQVPEQAQAGFGIVTRFIAECGLADLHGIGLSSVRTGDRMFHNRMVLQHPAGQGKGLYWEIFSQENGQLSLQDRLPANTVMAAQGYGDIKVLWAWIADAVQDSESTALIDAFEQGLLKAQQRGIPVEAWINSLGEGIALVITVDPEQKIPVPNPKTGQTMNIPGFAVAILIEVRDDTIFDVVDAMLGKQGNIQRNDSATMRSRTMTLPLPPTVQPTIARFGNFLAISSNAELIDQLATGPGGLTETELFKSMSANMPKTGVGFSFLSPAFGKAIGALMEASMTTGKQSAQIVAMNQVLFKGMMEQAVYGVALNLPDALVSVSNTNFDYGQNLVAQASIVPVAIMAGMLLPALSQARTKARRINDAGNLKQIGLALHMFSNDHDETFPDDLGVLMEQDYLTNGKVYTCPGGNTQAPANGDDVRAGRCDYLYFAKDRTIDNCGTADPIACTKPIFFGRFMNVLYGDRHVKGFVNPPPEVQALLNDVPQASPQQVPQGGPGVPAVPVEQAP